MTLLEGFFSSLLGNPNCRPAIYCVTLYRITTQKTKAEGGSALSSNREIESHLPLTPALFHVLLALADGDKHGYAILKEVSLLTGGEVRLSTGTLYGILKRLLQEGMIEESRRRPAAQTDDERRIYYHITSLGQRVTAAEAERHEKVVALARLKKVLRRPETT